VANPMAMDCGLFRPCPNPAGRKKAQV
jgi:hypothetical protein